MKQALIKRCSFILFALMSIVTYAQTASSQIKITGTVTDNSGLLLPGVNVTEKSSKNTVTTDYNGKYQISVKPGATLVFSFIGMKKAEIPLNGRTTLDAQLKEDSNQLENIVVVGYGTQKKTHVTGAVETIKMKEIEDLPTNSIATAIAGRVLGVTVSGGSSRPGQTGTIKIRQPRTLSKDGGSENPLYVIDGVIQIAGDGSPDSTLFNSLDASEVESLSFLKDAAAAIYGARAANGVVLVTTKKGRKGPAKFTYTGSYGIEDELYRTKMLNAYEYAQYYNIMNGPNGHNAITKADPTLYFFSQDELDYFKTIHYDQLNDYWEPASNQKHTLNVSGGTDRSTYFAGASYYSQGGNLANIDYSKWTFRSGADFNISNDFKAGIQISGFYSDNSKTNSRNGGSNEENDYRRLLNASPYMPEFINGLPVQRMNTSNESQYNFGAITQLGNVATSVSNNLSANFYAEYKVPFIKGLSTRASYARNTTFTRSDYIGTKFTIYQFQGTGDNKHIFDPSTNPAVLKANTYNNGNRIGWDNQSAFYEQMNFNVSYNRKFGKHDVSGLFAIEKGEAESTRDEFYKDDPLSTTNGTSGSAFGAIDGNATGTESGTLGYIGRINYSFDDKILAEFLYRSDASTRFSPDNYWSSFYSLSLGWIVSKESFFKSSVIDYLKFRTSVGKLGSDDTKAWQWRQRFTYQNGQGFVAGNSNGTTGMKMEVTPNPNATWSNQLKTNFGVEMKMLDSRLSVNAESYYNIGTDMLMAVTANVPFTVGGSVASENYGSRDEYGYELSLGWNDKIGKDFDYGINLNFSWWEDKMIKGNFNDVDRMKPWIAKEGESSDNGVWGYDYQGMMKSQGDVDAYVSKYGIKEVFGVKAADLRPGSLSYADVRGKLDVATGQFAAPDGIIDENDQIQLAKKALNHYGLGTTLKFGYKNFSLNAVITGSFGGWNEIDSQTRKTMKSAINDGIDNRPSIWNNIYDPVLNPNGTMPNPYSEAVNLSPTSTFWERSATSIELRNINLGYALPSKYLNALGISSLRFNFTALNPFILYNPFDYKNPNGAYDVYPTLKTYSLGLNLAF